MSYFRRIPLATFILGCLLPVTVCVAQDEAAADGAADSLSKREREFSEKLSGAALVGHFLIDGRDAGSKAERYEIESAKKVTGDDWVITARIKYGKYDLKVPVTLQVVWAGDTPVMSLTDLTIPVLGTFTARVMFYGDRYVGTWQHGKVGGHMFGHVRKIAAAERSEKK